MAARGFCNDDILEPSEQALGHFPLKMQTITRAMS
jgi:hypothetical protein